MTKTICANRSADGCPALEKLLQRHQRHEDGLLVPWRAALQQTRDRADDERCHREDNERRHRQTQRVAWISFATAVIATVISVLTAPSCWRARWAGL